MLWNAPIKKGYDDLLSDIVLDWPRRWREIHGKSPSDVINHLRVAGFEKYYDNADRFAQYSSENENWFLKGTHQPTDETDA